MPNVIAKLSRLIAALCLLALVGCSEEAGPVDGEVPLAIRVENTTDVDFESVTIVFPKQTEAYGPVAAGAMSGYHEVSDAYRYAAVTVEYGDEVSHMTPIDYVGEKLLSPGRYTYRLVWVVGPGGPTNQVWMEMVEDQTK